MATNKKLVAQCFNLFLNGTSPAEIEKKIGVSRPLQSMWKKRYKWAEKFECHANTKNKSYWEKLSEESEDVVARLLNVAKLLAAASQQMLSQVFKEMKATQEKKQMLNSLVIPISTIEDDKIKIQERYQVGRVSEASKIAVNSANIFKGILPSAPSEMVEAAIAQEAERQEEKENTKIRLA